MIWLFALERALELRKVELPITQSSAEHKQFISFKKWVKVCAAASAVIALWGSTGNDEPMSPPISCKISLNMNQHTLPISELNTAIPNLVPGATGPCKEHVQTMAIRQLGKLPNKGTVTVMLPESVEFDKP